MRTNVTRLELHRRYVEARDGDPERTSLMITIQDGEMKYPISPMLHGDWIINRFCQQCRGEIRWYDSVSFDDVGYQFRVHQDALEVWKGSGSMVDRHWFTFPMVIVAERIEQARVSAYQPESSYIFSEEEIASIRKAWWPKAKLVFSSDEARERFMDCLWMVPEGFTQQNKKELTNEIRGLIQIARNYSDGKVAEVLLSTDPYPHSFYWSIWYDGYRVFNGGIIAHKYTPDDGEPYYRYSTHT